MSSLPTSLWAQKICSTLAVSCIANLGFKLMWCSFACKLTSGCPEWNSGTAMAHHHRTTCLPKPLSKIMHLWTGQAKSRSYKQVLVTLLAEGPLSVLGLVGLRPARILCAAVWVGLMTSIALTGNYGFFNLLSSVLAVALIDDQLLGFAGFLAPNVAKSTFYFLAFDALLVAAVVAGWALYTAATVATVCEACVAKPPDLSLWAREKIHHLPYFGNRYGLFASMTTTRDEIVIKELHHLPPELAARAGGLVSKAGTSAGDFWVEISLPYKPGPLDRPPPSLLYHMPRLDWQLWFVSLSLGRYSEPPRWFSRFLKLLRQRRPQVVKLVAHSGQPEVQTYALKQEPLDVRVSLESYEFSDAEKDANVGGDWQHGKWWRRKFVDVTYG
eukprot:TRINITY_DN79234_c0_g1_i1.p1 TRINITY_DN79234_c0_g1~~TRINITY_DN79234_c0_g1_i1.p1  ORF type:complete len:409 (-),score=52.05 TRINITY_DN79234_c0_g1_i1:71-1225(-)